MNLSNKVNEYRKIKIALHFQRRVPSDIAERWLSRVVPNGLHELGELGAMAYLNRFGKGIGEEKVVYMAIKAEVEGCNEMACGFWKRAYEIGETKNLTSKVTGEQGISISTSHLKTGSTNSVRRLSKEAVQIKRRRLNVLEEQQAYQGLQTPPQITMEIEDLHRELSDYTNDKE